MQVSCSPHSVQSSILTIDIDGVAWRDIHTAVFGKKPQFPETCLSLEEFKEQFDAMEYQSAKNYALRRLSMQAMLSSALAKSLKERLVSSLTIHQLIQELTDCSYINDQEWSESFVRMQKNKKMGPRAIAQKLLSKGLENETLENVLENIRQPHEQQTLIQHLLRTRYAKRKLSDFKERQKVVASLVRRGFDLSIILESISSRRILEQVDYDEN